ncbi:hypothetical protein FJ364_01845 [Candidatus Dependentiae bacterium]|nr:hypothetical protein [Candidatus Dependentiae bacterium]
MTHLSFNVSGKLMLSGEWNILTPGRTCLTLPTKGMCVSITKAKEICITSAAYKLDRYIIQPQTHHQTPSQLFLNKLILSIIEQFSLFEIDIKPFHITLENDPCTYILNNGVTHKLGVGSSACAAVGITKAIALLHNKPLTTKTLFNTAMTAHRKAQGNMGSGFDIAAAASGSSIMYTSAKNTDHNDYVIEPVLLPPNWYFAVGFSGTSASTTQLIQLFNRAKENHLQKIESLLVQIEDIVQALKQTIKENNFDESFSLLQRNHLLLHKLSSLCDNALETSALTTMINIATSCGAAAKFSGAGGGDCVIALCPNEQIKQKVYRAWTAAGFPPADNLLLV